MKRLVLILVLLVFAACSNVSKEKPVALTEEAKSSIVVQWRDLEVGQVKINGKILERGKEYALPLGEYEIRWSLSKDGKQFKLKSYDADGNASDLEHDRVYWKKEKILIFEGRNTFTIDGNEISEGINQKF